VGTRVSYEVDGEVAVIGMDDGKVNALSNEMLEDVNDALDKASASGGPVVIHGRDGIFSAGFDLKTLQGGGPAAVEMLHSGFELSYRLLTFPTPVVIAVTGHAMAMGLFFTLSGDYRIGTDGDYKIVANEVAIGLTMPRAAVEICRYRLHPSHLQRVVNLSEQYTPPAAVDAGLLDRVVPAGAAVAEAKATAATFAATLNPAAHAASKLRLREHTLAALRQAIDADDAELRSAL